MIFIYIFIASLVGISLLCIMRIRRPMNHLQKPSAWYTIHVVDGIYTLHHAFIRWSRPMIRTFLYQALVIYQHLVKRIRQFIRKRIHHVLDYYSPKHDVKYTKNPSSFITEIKDHKDNAERPKDMRSLDEYSEIY